MKILLQNDLAINSRSIFTNIILQSVFYFIILKGGPVNFFLLTFLQIINFLEVFKKEEEVSWDVRLITLPIDRGDIVFYRYLNSIFRVLIVTLVLILISIFFNYNLEFIWIYVLLNMVLFSYFLPQYFKYSSKDGMSYSYFEFIMGWFLAVFILAAFWYYLGIDFIIRHRITILITLTILTTGIFINSYYRSVRNIEKKSYK